ncbi:hypothetical protein [Metabacillus iocasae]|uniref:ATP synthase F0 subunit 8 n=1 Tax=Priestia iocasae TaxID=2291674 RepID=A0ABS2QUR3_9BACI|nr:hypothetical protein [Metabacillus iocasae]MBM7703145.1 hypothetical protein [Metabacillus iocasae]
MEFFYQDLFIYVPYMSAILFYVICYYIVRESRHLLFHSQRFVYETDITIDSSVFLLWKRLDLFTYIYKKKPMKEKKNDDEDSFLLIAS